MTGYLRLRLDMGFEITAHDWQLLPQLGVSHFKPPGKARLWDVTASFLCFHAWIGRPHA